MDEDSFRTLEYDNYYFKHDVILASIPNPDNKDIYQIACACLVGLMNQLNKKNKYKNKDCKIICDGIKMEIHWGSEKP